MTTITVTKLPYMFSICWNKIIIWASKYFELHFYISFVVVNYRKIYYEARDICIFGPWSLGLQSFIGTVSNNRLLRPEWSINIIHKKCSYLQKINIHYQQRNFFSLVCTRYIFRLAICQPRHRGSSINKHNKY